MSHSKIPGNSFHKSWAGFHNQGFKPIVNPYLSLTSSKSSAVLFLQQFGI